MLNHIVFHNLVLLSQIDEPEFRLVPRDFKSDQARWAQVKSCSFIALLMLTCQQKDTEDQNASNRIKRYIAPMGGLFSHSQLNPQLK